MTVRHSVTHLVRLLAQLAAEGRRATPLVLSEELGASVRDVLALTERTVEAGLADHSHMSLGVITADTTIGLTADGWIHSDAAMALHPREDLEEKERELRAADERVERLMDYSPTQPGEPLPHITPELSAALDAVELAGHRYKAALRRYESSVRATRH